jgi:hypothetical protein
VAFQGEDMVDDQELIKAYVHEASNESGQLPWGAEARRKALGDELLARGITEFRLPAFQKTFKVRGSDQDAPKIEYRQVPLGQERQRAA